MPVATSTVSGLAWWSGTASGAMVGVGCVALCALVGRLSYIMCPGGVGIAP